MSLALGACSGGGPGAGPVDAAAIDSSAIDAPAADAAVIDAAPVPDAASLDASLTDASIDAPVVLTAPIGGLRYLAGGTQSSSQTATSIVALRDHPDDVVVTIESGDSLDPCAVRRLSLAGEVATTSVHGPCRAISLDHDRVAVSYISSLSLPVPGRPVAIFDLAAGTRVELLAPVAGASIEVTDVRAVGTGFEAIGYSGPGRRWTFDSAGTLIGDQPYATSWTRASFLPGASASQAATFVWPDAALTLVDLVTGAPTATALPFNGTPYVVTGSDRAWLVGRIGGQAAAMPLGATVPTLFTANAALAGTVDADGRLLVAFAGAPGTVEVVRLDERAFDGTNGNSRLDPTFGPAGRAWLEFSQPCVLCPPGAMRVAVRPLVAVDATGHVVIAAGLTVPSTTPSIFPAVYIGWYQVP